VNDGNGGTNTATIDVTVTWVNDKPISTDKILITREDTPLNGNLSDNDTQSRDGGNVWCMSTNPGQGKVTVNDDGEFNYVPNAKFVGKDSFTYSLRDINGDASVATVTIDVLAMPEVIKTSSNPVRHNDGTFSWVYTITLINDTNQKIDSIQVVDNLDDVFAPKGCTYKTTGIAASGHLTANGLYNGSSVVNLLVQGSTMAINSRDSIQFEVRVDTHGQPDTVSVTNQALCSGKDSFGSLSLNSNPDQTIIPGVNLFIPDAFSPNGDGINDDFVIIHPVSLRIEIEVFNRWGNLVFKSTDYQNNWDGRGIGNFLGQELPVGTYFCSCKAINVLNGTVVSNGVKYVTLRR
jgi:gliding motility-associated-like protein